MKVLNISTDYHLLASEGGSPNDSQHRHRLYGSLVEHLDIIVLCRTPVRESPLQLSENVRVFPALRSFRPATLLAAYRLAKGLHQERSYDCVTVQDPFTCGFVGWRLKRKCRLPLNVQIHAEFLDNPHWIDRSLSRRLLNIYGKRILRRADTVRVGTTRQKTHYASKMGVPERDIFFLPVLVGAALFQKEPAEGLKEKLFACGRKKVLLYAGRFERAKNLGMLLEAVDKLRSEREDFFLALIGDGPDKDRLERKVREKNLDRFIRFFGFVERNRVADYFLGADILVLTSIFEGTCRVLVEAAFASRPVVTTHIAGADDIVVDGKTGFVVAINDWKTFGERLSVLLDSEALRNDMGLAARRHITGFFNEEKFLHGLLGMWRATAEKGRA